MRLQIVHLKRFHFVVNKWVKSQKIVDFPLRNFDPTDYLASVPRQTILMHKAELEGVDPAVYIAGLHEKDNVFLEIVPENKVPSSARPNALSLDCLPPHFLPLTVDEVETSSQSSPLTSVRA